MFALFLSSDRFTIFSSWKAGDGIVILVVSWEVESYRSTVTLTQQPTTVTAPGRMGKIPEYENKLITKSLSCIICWSFGNVQNSAKRWRLGCVFPHPGLPLATWVSFMHPSLLPLADFSTLLKDWQKIRDFGFRDWLAFIFRNYPMRLLAVAVVGSCVEWLMKISNQSSVDESTNDIIFSISW